MTGDGGSAPFAADKKQQQQVLVVQPVAREASGGKAGMIDIDRQFLGQFADQRLLGRFAGFDLAARELPQSGHRLAFRTLLNQQPAVAIDKRCRYDNECFSCDSHAPEPGQIVNLPVRPSEASGTITSIRGGTMNKFHGLLRSTRAATAVEYGLILALIFVAAMLAITAVGTSTNKMWTKVSDTSVNAMGGG